VEPGQANWGDSACLVLQVERRDAGQKIAPVGSADAREQPDEKEERQSNGGKAVGANRAQACRPGEQQDGEEWDELIRPKQSGHSEYQTGLNHEAQLQAIHGSDSNAMTLYWNVEEAARGNYESNTVEANLCRQKFFAQQN
jgi:hypothetical protein